MYGPHNSMQADNVYIYFAKRQHHHFIITPNTFSETLSKSSPEITPANETKRFLYIISTVVSLTLHSDFYTLRLKLSLDLSPSPIQSNKFRSFRSLPELARLVISESSDLNEIIMSIDRLILHGEGNLGSVLISDLENLGCSERVRGLDGWFSCMRCTDGRNRLCTEDSSVPNASGEIPALVISVIGVRVPPARAVSTANWHTCHMPRDISPTAPSTGFTVRPHASYSKDWNKAEDKRKTKYQAYHFK